MKSKHHMHLAIRRCDRTRSTLRRVLNLNIEATVRCWQGGWCSLQCTMIPALKWVLEPRDKPLKKQVAKRVKKQVTSGKRWISYVDIAPKDLR